MAWNAFHSTLDARETKEVAVQSCQKAFSSASRTICSVYIRRPLDWGESKESSYCGVAGAATIHNVLALPSLKQSFSNPQLVRPAVIKKSGGTVAAVCDRRQSNKLRGR